MNRELLMLVEAIAREKNVDRDVVFGAIEMALAQATRKLYEGDIADVELIDRICAENQIDAVVDCAANARRVLTEVLDVQHQTGKEE